VDWVRFIELTLSTVEIFDIARVRFRTIALIANGLTKKRYYYFYYLHGNFMQTLSKFNCKKKAWYTGLILYNNNTGKHNWRASILNMPYLFLIKNYGKTSRKNINLRTECKLRPIQDMLNSWILLVDILPFFVLANKWQPIRWLPYSRQI
jgi:hypothetical protein